MRKMSILRDRGSGKMSIFAILSYWLSQDSFVSKGMRRRKMRQTSSALNRWCLYLGIMGVDLVLPEYFIGLLPQLLFTRIIVSTM